MPERKRGDEGARVSEDGHPWHGELVGARVSEDGHPWHGAAEKTWVAGLKSGKTVWVRVGRLQSISESQMGSETRDLRRRASSMEMWPEALFLAAPSHSGWRAHVLQSRCGGQRSRVSMTPHLKRRRLPSLASAMSLDMRPCGWCMVLRHSMAPRTWKGPQVAERVVSCAADQTSSSRGSTSSQRSFWGRVPRTEAWD